MKIPNVILAALVIWSGFAFGAEHYQYPAREEAAAATGKARLFILSGQSNMERFDPAISFTPAVIEAFGKDSVIVVKDAKGSQPISRWDKNWKSVEGKEPKRRGDLYDRLMKTVGEVTKGREIESVTFLWMQGEAEASHNQVPVYEAALERLLKQLEGDLKRDDITLVLGRLSDYSLDNGKHPQWQQMRDLQVKFADASASRAWVNTDDLNDKVNKKTGELKNDVHYTPEGYRIFGERLAKEAIQLVQSR